MEEEVRRGRRGEQVNDEDIYKRLTEPFDEGEIKWRVQGSGFKTNGDPWIRVVPHVDSRAIQRRLDEVFGVFGWENQFIRVENRNKKEPEGFICGITAYSQERSVTKWDGAEYTDFAPFKGGISGSEKRAAVQWGVGRYLYMFEEQYPTCRKINTRWDLSKEGVYQKIVTRDKDGKIINSQHTEWFRPDLPEWAKPSFEADSFIDKINNATNMNELREVFKDAYSYATSFQRDNLLEEIKIAKDKKKEEFVKSKERLIAKQDREVSSWLKQAIEDYIAVAKNKTTLKTFRGNLIKDIFNKTNKSDLDQDKFLGRLTEACDKRMRELSR